MNANMGQGAVEKGPSAVKALFRSGEIRRGTVAPECESTAEGGCSTLFQQPRFPPWFGSYTLTPCSHVDDEPNLRPDGAK